MLEGRGPARGLVAALGRGTTVFRQARHRHTDLSVTHTRARTHTRTHISCRQGPFYVEFFSALLVPWTHYVPVADNLADLAERVAWAEANPARAAEIGAAGQLLASRLHAHEIACFWWQLLTAFAPLQDFEPRAGGSAADSAGEAAPGLVRYTGREPRS